MSLTRRLTHAGRPARAAIGPIAAVALCASLPGCATVAPRDPTLIPTRSRVDAGPFAIYSNSVLHSDGPLVSELLSLRGEVVSRLALDDIESPQPIEVYILDNRNTFRHFLTFYYPELPPRRAFFFAQGDRRVVYAYQGDRLVEDLRHEATHALLNQCVVDLPLWLDEGLAEYFESDPTRGVNEEHVAHLPRDVADGWRPDLARLEAMADVRAMTPRDYREAWAWVHFLLESSESTRHDLLDYLAELRAGGDPEPMSRRLDERGLAAAHELLSHVTRLTSPELAARAQDARSIVRMQSGREVTRRIVPEPSSPRLEPMQRQMKGLFGPIARAFDWLDLRTARNRGRR